MTQLENNKIVKTGMVIGVIATLFLFVLLYIVSPKFSYEVELLPRIKLAIMCLVFPAAFYLVTIVRIGSQRFGNPSDNPLLVVANSNAMAVNLRVLANTHEQVVLFALTTLALSVLLPFNYLSLLPIYSAIFFIGRIIFWLAYKHNPLWRAPGFAMGILPEVAGLGYCCVAVVIQLLF